MDRHGLVLDDLGRSELHAGLLARTAAIRMDAEPCPRPETDVGLEYRSMRLIDHLSSSSSP
eukprot:3191184-Alexandrium_andersonii.AAC.1